MAMSGDIVYADLNIPGEPPSRGRGTLPQPHSHPRCPRWHRPALGATWVGNTLLLGAALALAGWAWNNPAQRNYLQGFLNLSLAGAAPNTMENKTSTQPIPTGSRFSNLEEFRSHLQLHLCETRNDTPAEVSCCKLCPKDWLLQRDKCYWLSKEIKSWEQSREDCLTKRAHLLMIHGLQEMAFLRNNALDKHQVWIGLNITSPGRMWTWQDGSPLNQTLFPVVDPDQENNCASVKKSKIHSEICQTDLKWVCQKGAVLV